MVILVEQGAEASDSLRLRQSYYRTGADDTALAAPLTRDEALLLSPQTTLETILQCWSERDWPRLYLYIARRDPATGLERSDYAAFAAQMDALPHLTRWDFSGGSGSIPCSRQIAFSTSTSDALQRAIACLPSP